MDDAWAVFALSFGMRSRRKRATFMKEEARVLADDMPFSSSNVTQAACPSSKIHGRWKKIRMARR